MKGNKNRTIEQLRAKLNFIIAYNNTLTDEGERWDHYCEYAGPLIDQLLYKRSVRNLNSLED